MASVKPTVVLVHGAWHTTPNYRRYIDALTAAGFTVYCPAVRRTLEPLVNAGQRVLLLMHSYGGAIGTDDVKDLTRPERQAQNLPGGITHLTYLCAYILRPGSTVLSVVEEVGMSHLWPHFVENVDDGSTSPVDPVLLFLGGVEKNLVDEALPHLVRSPQSAFTTPTEGDAWRRVPVTYVLTQEDYSVPRVYKDLMINKVKEDGIQPRLLDYKTSHSVFLTHQKDMVKVVLESAEDERNLI